MSQDFRCKPRCQDQQYHEYLREQYEEPMSPDMVSYFSYYFSFTIYFSFKPQWRLQQSLLIRKSWIVPILQWNCSDGKEHQSGIAWLGFQWRMLKQKRKKMIGSDRRCWMLTKDHGVQSIAPTVGTVTGAFNYNKALAYNFWLFLSFIY